MDSKVDLMNLYITVNGQIEYRTEMSKYGEINDSYIYMVHGMT